MFRGGEAATEPFGNGESAFAMTALVIAFHILNIAFRQVSLRSAERQPSRPMAVVAPGPAGPFAASPAILFNNFGSELIKEGQVGVRAARPSDFRGSTRISPQA
jgi:hypothetical protein